VLDAQTDGRVLVATVPVTVNSLTVQRGLFSVAPFSGGGARFDAAAVLVGVTFISNTLTNGGAGAGAFFDGPATVTSARFINNNSGNAGGGAFFNGPATLTGAHFISNSAGNGGGGALFNGHTTISASTFISNFAGGGGGGGAFFFDLATLSYTDFISNTSNQNAGGALFSHSSVLEGGTFSGNTTSFYGGGAYFFRAATITRTTFISNHAGTSAGGVWFDDEATLAGARFISNNANSDAGGALFSSLTSRSVMLVDSEFISNTSGGISQTGSSLVTSDYNLFFGNTADVAGSVVTGSNSVIGHPFFVNDAADNYRISPSSFAANRGTRLGIATDFDSNPRPFGPQVDIGAFEVQSANQPPAANAGAPFTVTVNALVTLNGSASSDPEGQPLLFGWSQVSGTPVTLSDSSAVTPTFTAPALTGTLVFQLVVTDALGLSSTPAWVTVTIASGAVPPSGAGLTHTVGSGLQPTTFFTATVAGGTGPFTYEWAFSDGVTSMGSEPFNLRQLAPGVYTVTLTVSNTAGAASATQQVMVPWRMTLAIIVKDSTLPMLQHRQQ
jgi:hypothetical protein